MTTIHVKPYACEAINSMLEPHTRNRSIAIISDYHTIRACGWENDIPLVYNTHYCFDHSPKASYSNALDIIGYAKNSDYIIGIGSGTINDLCKYAAHQLTIPYGIIATAPSMNGYVSPNASLMHHGHKQTFQASPPDILIADTNILSHAPKRLIASGVGDTLCRTTVEQDALLSHHYCNTTNYSQLFSTLLQAERSLLEALLHYETNHHASTLAFMHSLMMALIEGGQAMGKAGNSAPASQGEHMLAHVLETLYPDISSTYYHGEVIAVTTLTMARIQEKLNNVSHSPPHLPSFPEKLVATYVKEDTYRQWYNAYLKKQESISKHLQPYSPSATQLTPDVLEDYLKRAGCPTTPQELGFTQEQYDVAVKLAPYSRDRFTYLDMIAT